MATSGTKETNHIAAPTRVWYWEFKWSATYSGNTATVSWEIFTRCESGTSAWVNNYGFSGNVHNTNLSNSNRFEQDNKIASGSFTLGGGQSFNVNITAKPYGSSGYTSSGSWTFTLDNKVVTPTVTCTGTKGLNTIAASMSVTNNGGAAIVDKYIDLFSDSACTKKLQTITGASGTFTGLTPNTTYYIKANASNGVYRGYSSVASVTTYNKATISSASNFNLGSNLAVTYANPSGQTTAIAISNSTGSGAYANYRSCSGTSYTFTFTDTELDTMYKAMGTGTTLTIRVYIRTTCNNTNYYDYKELTVTLKGNQKTIHEKINGNWKRGKVWIKVNGNWKQGVVWEKVNGNWKRCI